VKTLPRNAGASEYLSPGHAVAKPVARPVTGKERIAMKAGKGQLAWLAGLVEAPSALFEVTLAGQGIDDSHGGKVTLALQAPQ